MAQYSKNSPWYATKQNALYLETMAYRKIMPSTDDAKYVIENQYTHRPDLLAYDFYGDAKLWWVFVNRNRNVLKDPIFDFVAGVEIYLPNKESLLVQIME